MTDSKWTENSVPSQAGRTVVVTGANTGIGYETARVLAARGASVVLAVRNLDKGKDAASRISAATPGADVTVQKLDLGSLASVREAAEELRTVHDRIDLLVNNAGVMYTPYSHTADGFEQQFGTNHLGHFALTGLLLDRLTSVPGSRIVTVSSVAHKILAKIHFDDLQWERGFGLLSWYGRVAAYGQSKLANLMFTYELQRRLVAASAPTVALAAHPGVSSTELIRNSPAPMRAMAAVSSGSVRQPPAMGALPTLRAATDPSAEGGLYYGPAGFQELTGNPVIVSSTSQSHDADQQRRLWTVSEELTGVSFPI
jgi:NAD(P)-dependent dehydrogenase (short-subunit alcohol dehydrogenase family)